MVDADGFRPNVGIILTNGSGQVLWARRVGGHDAWQFPQGGINADESAEDALYRELFEEVGLERDSVEVIARTRGWLRYRLPDRFIRKNSKPLCIGQKQRWFILRLTSDEDRLRFDRADKPEFDRVRWVPFWRPVNEVIYFKRRERVS